MLGEPVLHWKPTEIDISVIGLQKTAIEKAQESLEMSLLCLLRSCFTTQEVEPLWTDDTESQTDDQFHQVTNGHNFKVTRFHQVVRCAVCSHRIWGLGRKSYRCVECNLHLHKDCYHLPYSHCPSADTAIEDWETSPDPAIPETTIVPSTPTVQDYDVLKCLGRGNYGTVLKVRNKETQGIYAMKVVKKDHPDGEEDISWMYAEKRVFEEGANHPFLVGLHAFFESESCLFFVIEYVNGRDLCYIMACQKTLEEAHAVFYTAEISLALNYLHTKGIIHRDIKPDNILLDAEGHIKLTDYGVCKDGLKPGDTTGTFCGTPSYTAPEILREDLYNYSVDWWSLGIVTFEMLAGRTPFSMEGSTYNPDMDPTDVLYEHILEKEVTFPDNVSVVATDFISALLQKDPKHRLGCYNQTFVDIQGHPFFRDIHWDLLEEKKLDPPFQPDISEDTNDQIDQSQFTNFDCVNPTWL